MPLLSVTDQSIWDGFIASQPGSQFTQSWAWGEFRKSKGHIVERIAYTDDRRKWLAAASFAYHPKTLSGFWYAQRGPIVRHDLLSESKRILSEFFGELKSRGFARKSLFWRCEPPIEYKREELLFLPPFVRAHSYQPAATIVLDLTKSEDELLSIMHEKTRYNVRLAERKGVRVRTASSPADLDVFFRLNAETSTRDEFRSQSDAYIRATYDALRPIGMTDLRIAEIEGEPLAANIEIAYGDTVTYLYGASASAKRNVMAPYALQWDAIRAAKRSGHRFYDFYGVNPEDRNSPTYKPSWEGITRFKSGWGGKRVEYVGTYELPMMPFAYRIARMFLR